MIATQVRPKCPRRAALASALSLSSLPSTSRLGTWKKMNVVMGLRNRKEGKSRDEWCFATNTAALGRKEVLLICCWLESFTRVISSILSITLGGKGTSELNVLLWWLSILDKWAQRGRDERGGAWAEGWGTCEVGYSPCPPLLCTACLPGQAQLPAFVPVLWAVAGQPHKLQHQVKQSGLLWWSQ